MIKIPKPAIFAAALLALIAWLTFGSFRSGKYSSPDGQWEVHTYNQGFLGLLTMRVSNLSHTRTVAMQSPFPQDQTAPLLVVWNKDSRRFVCFYEFGELAGNVGFNAFTVDVSTGGGNVIVKIMDVVYPFKKDVWITDRLKEIARQGNKDEKAAAEKILFFLTVIQSR